jgi:ribosomal protein L11|tara:strand:- start:3354 stop:3548 length:195 start_codon:yes stop_codon:yes gene_type:complete
MNSLNDDRNKAEMGEYVVFLIESGYAEWDARVGACVFNEGVDTKAVMKEYTKKMKSKTKHENTG